MKKVKARSPVKPSKDKQVFKNTSVNKRRLTFLLLCIVEVFGFDFS